MKYAIFFCSCMMAFSNVFAQQNVGPLKLDPTFANNGTSEIDFEGFNDDATCYVVNLALNRILVAGKIYTSTPGEVRFGMTEYDANGMLETGFGTNGKADLSWDSVDYPTTMDLMPDGSILAVGASATYVDYDNIPTIFKVKANGTPDSSFGSNGRVQVSLPQLRFLGEFENLDTLRLPNMAFRGIATGILSPLINGFYVVRFDSTGSLDTSFGPNGLAVRVTPIISAHGHLINGDSIMLVGLDTGIYPKIILCKLLPNGLSDSSFGMNSVLNTRIALHGGDQIQSVYDPFPTSSDPYPGLLVAAPLSDSSAMLPFTIIKFKLDGTLDSNYGLNGIATAPVISSMKIYGMTPPNAKGYTHLCGGIGNVSATVQFLPNGAMDSTFGTNGIALLDADNGLRKNSLVGFVPLPGKKFIGVGTSVNAAGNDDFLVARYIQGVAGVSPANTDNSQAVQLYPNPAHGFVQVEVPSGPIEQISIVDALGRIVLSFERPSYAANSNAYFLDVSNIPNGAYSCTIRTDAGIASQWFTVIH